MTPRLEKSVPIMRESMSGISMNMVPINLVAEERMSVVDLKSSIQEMIDRAKRGTGIPEVKYIVVRDVMYIFSAIHGGQELYHIQVLRKIKDHLQDETVKPQAAGKMRFIGDRNEINSDASTIFQDPDITLSKEKSDDYLNHTVAGAFSPGRLIVDE